MTLKPLVFISIPVEFRQEYVPVQVNRGCRNLIAWANGWWAPTSSHPDWPIETLTLVLATSLTSSYEALSSHHSTVIALTWWAKIIQHNSALIAPQSRLKQNKGQLWPDQWVQCMLLRFTGEHLPKGHHDKGNVTITNISTRIKLWKSSAPMINIWNTILVCYHPEITQPASMLSSCFIFHERRWSCPAPIHSICNWVLPCKGGNIFILAGEDNWST